MTRPTLSIVIPTAELARVRRDWLETMLGVPGVVEILIALPTDHVDVGPTALPDSVRLVRAPLGRGSQMNAGALSAIGEFLLFLHADTFATPDALRALIEAFRRTPDRAYAFRLAFHSRRWPYRALTALARWRDRVWPFPLGDQGFAMRRETFLAEGGFPDVPLFEDSIVTRRARRSPGLEVLPVAAPTSPARFERRGVFRTLTENVFMLLLFGGGMSTRRLVAYYYGPEYLARWTEAHPARQPVSAPQTSARARTTHSRRNATIRIVASIVGLLFLAGAAWGVDHTHALFDGVLMTHVEGGRVAYPALQAEAQDPASGFARYLDDLAATGEDESTWSREERLAYWINAYNAFTLKLIVDHYPIRSRWYTTWIPPVRAWLPPNSILQIPGRWDEITFDSVRGPITLGAIEHEILRPEFEDPRIHFAIVCASIGCPDLRSIAFHPTTLEAEMDEATADFMADREKVRLEDEDRLRVSQIFKWFREDFDVAPRDAQEGRAAREEDAGVLRWVMTYAPPALRTALAAHDIRIGHLKYDWHLNEQKPPEGES